ncbi:hypothetical protein ACFO3U_08080 [Flavobacterium ponti]|uniref:DUF4878 domain-containing protein n=1 Tax=Flavobacterium ponti TaxID=665133 RepID=A0ABV9P6B5_9FLAO
MKIIFAFIFLTLFSCKNFNQEDKLLENIHVTDEEIYEVINLIIGEHDKAMEKDGFKINFYRYVLDRDSEPLFSKTDSLYIFKTDTIFSKNDARFIQQQIINRKEFKFKSNYIKSKKVISEEIIKNIINERYKTGQTFYEIYEQKFGENLYYRIGLPVFSVDKKTVFIKFDSFGSGETLIYKKVKNKWRIYCKISNWIS